MNKVIALFSVASLACGALALADAPKSTAKKSGAAAKPSSAKLIDVKTCPIYDAPIPASDLAKNDSEVYGKYKLHFCCGGCKPNFDKLTAAQKKAKVEMAIKKDAEESKSKKGA